MGKKINLELKNKLRKYSAAAGSIILGNTIVNAQISYSDINPDRVLTGAFDSFEIDLDVDSNNDLLFQIGTGTFAGSFVSGPYVSSPYIDYINAGFAGGQNNPELVWDQFIGIDALSSNYLINNGAYFFSPYTTSELACLGAQVKKVAQSFSYTSYSFQGIWPGKSNKYLGLKFQIGSFTHYGWVRMDLTPDCDTIIIKDYAYNTVPNQGILAGQTALSMNEEEKQISIYGYQQSVYINRVENSVSQVQVFGLDGKLVFEKSIAEKHEIISFHHLPRGIYLVEVDGITKKIVF